MAESSSQVGPFQINALRNAAFERRQARRPQSATPVPKQSPWDGICLQAAYSQRVTRC